MAHDTDAVESLLSELIKHQQAKVLRIARELLPHLTPEDIRNPQDFPELLRDPGFNYEDGILTGYLSAQTAIRAQARKGVQADV